MNYTQDQQDVIIKALHALEGVEESEEEIIQALILKHVKDREEGNEGLYPEMWEIEEVRDLVATALSEVVSWCLILKGQARWTADSYEKELLLECDNQPVMEGLI